MELILFLLTMAFGSSADKSGALAGTDEGTLHIGSWTSPKITF